MNHRLRHDAEQIAREAVERMRPRAAVRRALEGMDIPGEVCLVAVGKAAWQMADAAVTELRRPVKWGFVLTKYGHVEGEIPGVVCREAGHPVPDENSFSHTRQILALTKDLTESDTVLFLLSGGGSALFEDPLVSGRTLQAATDRLLRAGADIRELNTVRKRLSRVKGGRFGQWCAPARVEAVILSDVLGDAVDVIASGPAAADPSVCAEALAVAEKYGLDDPAVLECLSRETPKSLENVRTQIIGSVRELCRAAEEIARGLGYEPILLTDRLEGEAAEAGREMGRMLAKAAGDGRKLAFIAGGETVVHVRGTGLGGRNQELALAAARELDGIPNAALISLGSDGTDGPTDAAGGYADGDTYGSIPDYDRMLENNDAYHALDPAGCLIKTGPTGTNVNDLTLGLVEGTDLRNVQD